MNRYSEYKDSGVEWIGEIPRHWELRKIKRVCNLITEKRLPGYNEIKISPENVESETGRVFDFFSKYESEGQAFCKGDILFNKLGVHLNKVVFCAWSGLSMGELIVLRPFQLENKYLFRVLNSQIFISYATSLSQGVTLPRVPVITLLNSQLPIPSISEQQQIANFLDKKTAKIDSLVEKLERKIELLKEYRVALISHCVTKGLDPDVEMKDSGIEWIGEIPRHWEVKRLAACGQFSKGKSITKGDLTLDGFPCILYGELYTKYDRVVEKPQSRIDKELFDKSVRVSNGVLLFTSSGETVEEIGKCIAVKCDDVAVGGDSNIFHIHSREVVDIDFLSFALNSNYCQFYKSANSRGDIVVHIYEKQLRDLEFCSPVTQGEQNRISEFLIHQENTINQIIENEIERIELLKEYRHSLISHVVTGKVRVTEDKT